MNRRAWPFSLGRRGRATVAVVCVAILVAAPVLALTGYPSRQDDPTLHESVLPPRATPFTPTWDEDEVLRTWGRNLGLPGLAGVTPPVTSQTLGVTLPPASLAPLYWDLAAQSDDPLSSALYRWQDAAGSPDDAWADVPFEASRDVQVAAATLLFALADATDLQASALADLTPDEQADLAALLGLLAGTQWEHPSAEQARAMQAALAASERVRMTDIDAATQIVASTVSYVLPGLEEWAASRRAAEESAAAARPALDAYLAQHATADSAPANGFRALEDALELAAGWAGVDVPPAGRAAEPLGPDPLAEAVEGVLSLVPAADALGPAVRDQDAFAALPPGPQRAVARILLAYGDWLAALSGDGEAADPHEAGSALAAQIRLVQAVERSAPVLEAWGLMLSHSGGAMLPKSAEEAGVAEEAMRRWGEHLADKPAGASAALETLSWSQARNPAETSEGPPLPPPGQLETYVLSLYETLGIEPTPEDRAALHEGVTALPENVERNAARILGAQLDAAHRIHDAQAGLTAQERSAIARAADPEMVRRVAVAGWVSTEDLETLRTAYQAHDRVTAAYYEAASEVAAAVDASARHFDPPAQEPAEAGDDPWYGQIFGWIPEINVIGTASAQVPPPPEPDGCPEGNVAARCDEDIWFADPVLETIVVSGFESTTYDPRTLGKSVRAEFGILDVAHTVVRGQILSLDLGGQDVYRNNAGGAWPILGGPFFDINELSSKSVDPTVVAVALDMGGNDLYRQPPADFPSSGIQGAGLGGIGILYDVEGNDIYDAETAAQGFGAGHPTGGRADVECERPDTPVEDRDPGCIVGMFGIGILVDGDGTDSYSAKALAQGAGAAADDLGSALVRPAGPILGGAGILWDDGDGDRYTLDKAKPAAVGQGGASAGIGLLIDTEGDDTYRDGSQGQATQGGLGVLVDIEGRDSYTRAHPVFGRPMTDEECWTDLRAPRGSPLGVDPTQPSESPWYSDVTVPLTGLGVFADADPSAPCDPEVDRLVPDLPPLGGVVTDPAGDSDQDGWPDSLEELVSPGWGSDGTKYPAGLPSEAPVDDWPPTLPNGQPLPVGSSYILHIPGVLAVGDAVKTTYVAGEEAAVTLDLGGEDDHFDAAGSDFRLLVDFGPDDDMYAAPGRGQGANGMLLDLGGNDVYWASSDAQGVASAGAFSPAVGLLFDAVGDDIYVVDAGARTAAQGGVADRDDATPIGGGGTGLALGLLLDATGDDTYASPSQGVVAFGKGLSSDVALFLDLRGQDTYSPAGDQGWVRETEQGGWGTVASTFSPALAAFVDAQGHDAYRGVVGHPAGPDFTPVRNDRVRVVESPRGLGAPPAIGLFLDEDPASADFETQPEPILHVPGLGVRIGTATGDVYAEDYALLIDPGGADTYQNNAGSSLLRPVSVSTATQGAEASVATGGMRPLAATLIDLGRDPDTYEASDLPGQAFLIAAAVDPEAWEQAAGLLSQGSGFLGVGLMVDEAGADTYRCRALCQGFGLLGSGILWDRQGDDEYTFEASALGPPSLGGGLTAWREFDGLSWTLKARFAGGQEFVALPEGVEGEVGDVRVTDGTIVFTLFNHEERNWDVYVVRPMPQDDGTVDLFDWFHASSHPANQRNPVLAAPRIIWEDDRDGDIDLYWRPSDPVAVAPQILVAGPDGSQQLAADAADDWFVWQDDRSGAWDVHLARLADPASAFVLSATLPGENTAPRISDSFVVWQTRSSASEDSDVVVYNRKTTVDPLRVLDLPGDQVAPDVAGGIVVYVDEGPDGDQDQVVRYDWEADSSTPFRTAASRPALDDEDIFSLAWMEDAAALPFEGSIPPAHPAIVRGSLAVSVTETMSSVHERSFSRMVQGAGWQSGLGLLLDEGGLDTYHGDEFAQGVAFTLGHPVEDFPDSLGESSNSGGNQHLVQGVLADLEGNDVYEGRRFSQGAHVGGPQGQLVQANAPGQAPVPLAYFEASQTMGLLLDVRGSDRYVANQYSQGISGLTFGFFTLNAQQQGNPQAYAVDSWGILADLGQVDRYDYAMDLFASAPLPAVPACPTAAEAAQMLIGQGDLGFLADSLTQACSSVDGEEDPSSDASDREDSTWRQRTRTESGPPVLPPSGRPEFALNEGGHGFDIRLMDVLGPEMERAGAEAYRVTLEVPTPTDGLLRDTVTLEADVERTGSLPEAAVEVKRVEFLLDGVLLGHKRPTGGCPSGCQIALDWDTTETPDGNYEVEVRVQLGTPASSTPTAFVRDLQQGVKIDNPPVILDLSVDSVYFSPFPFAVRPGIPAHPTVQFGLNEDLDPDQRGWTSVDVRDAAGVPVRTLLDTAAVTEDVFVTWDGTADADGKAVPSGDYEIVVTVSDRPDFPGDRTQSVTVPLTVDSVGPVGSCVRLGSGTQCNGPFDVNLNSGTFNPLDEVVTLTLPLEATDDFPLANAQVHAFVRDPATNDWSAVAADPAAAQVTIGHDETRELVILFEDDVGNLECAPGCGAIVNDQVMPGDPGYVESARQNKLADASVVPSAAFTSDLIAPFLVPDTLRYDVDGQRVEFGPIQRVGPASTLDLEFKVVDPTGTPLTADFSWVSFERDPPLEVVQTETCCDPADPDDTYGFDWGDWAAIVDAWPADLEGFVVMEVDVHDQVGNPALPISTSLLLDRTPPVVTDAEAVYLQEGRFHATPGDEVDLVVDAFDPALLGFVVQRNDLDVRIDASLVSSLDSADDLPLAFKPSRDAFVYEDLVVDPPDPLDAESTTYQLPLTVFDSVGNVHLGSSVPIVIGEPALGLALDSEELGVFEAELTFTTDKPSNVVLEYGTDGTFPNSATTEPESTQTVHRFVLDSLDADTEYLYRIVATDAATGAKESLVGFSFRTGIGLDVAIDSPDPGSTLGGIVPVRVTSFAEGMPAGEPRITLSIARTDVADSTPQVLLDERTVDAVAGLDLVTDALPDGEYRLEALAALGPEETTAVVEELTLDNAAPDLHFLDPSPDSMMAVSPETLRLGVTDASSAVNPHTVRVFVDGNEALFTSSRLQSAADDGMDLLVVEGLGPLPTGVVRIAVSVEDAVGNIGSASVRFLHDPDSPDGEVRVVYPEGQSAVRPGQFIDLRVTATDRAGVRGVHVNGTGLGLTEDLTFHRSGETFVRSVRMPANVADGPLPLDVRLVDNLGSTRSIGVAVDLDASPIRILDWRAIPVSKTEAVVVLWTSEPPDARHLALTSPDADLPSVVADVRPGSDAWDVAEVAAAARSGPWAAFAASDLAAGTEYDAKFSVRDGGGHVARLVETWTFAPRVVAPPAVHETQAHVTTVSDAVMVAWNVSQDVEDAIFGVVQRSDGGLFRPVAKVSGSQWTDQTVEPGTTYRYFVQSENLLGERGAAGPIVEAYVPVVPKIDGLSVHPSTGREDTTFRFNATLSAMPTADPAVWLTVDTAAYPMEPANPQDDCRTRCSFVFRSTLPVLDLRTPEHRFYVEVFSQDAAALRFPAADNLTGPTVLSGSSAAWRQHQADAEGFGLASGWGALPMLIILAIWASVHQNRSRSKP